jgi:hypothetical protein
MITAKLRGAEEVNAFLKALPHGSMKAAVAAMAKYMIGDDYHGLRHYPARVHHGPGNPYKWQSDKQRRAYFATDGFGKGIPYRRSGKLKEGWRSSADPYRKTLFNRVPYSQYVMGNRQQLGHLADKWRRIKQVMATNIKGGMAAATKAVALWIKSKGK